MNILIIHDNEGYIISIRSGEPSVREPVGVPFLWTEIPEGKKTKSIGEVGVDVSVTPHQVILENIPPTEIELVRLEMARNSTELFETMLSMIGGV